MFQSLKGIIGDFNKRKNFNRYSNSFQAFQSLKGIIGDFNFSIQSKYLRTMMFQSLKGIIGDFNWEPVTG